MSNVVAGDPFQRGGLIVVDVAKDFGGGGGKIVDHVSQKAIVRGPEIDKKIPIHVSEALEIN